MGVFFLCLKSKKIEINIYTIVYNKIIFLQNKIMPSSKELNERIEKLEKLVNDLQSKADSLEINDKKSESKPKKPKAKTGYLIFSSEKREEIKKILSDENGETPKPKEVISKLGAVWKSLSPNEQQVYNDKAKLIAESDNNNNNNNDN